MGGRSMEKKVFLKKFGKRVVSLVLIMTLILPCQVYGLEITEDISSSNVIIESDEISYEDLILDNDEMEVAFNEDIKSYQVRSGEVDSNTLSLGGGHGAIIKTDGSLWMWGQNHRGQLGDGTTAEKHAPVKIMDNVKSVSLGNSHSAAIKTDGSLWIWGDNWYGVLGLGSLTSSQHSPVKLMDNVKNVSLGLFHSAAIKTDGSLWMWGDTYSGILGDGETSGKDIPVKIMDNVKSVSLGSAHSAAIKMDGSLWAWGNNEYGQLGDGTTADKYLPVKIMDNMKSVSLGPFHSAAIKIDGSLYVWGNNSSGQLGDGTTANKDTPVKIMDNVNNVSLGGSSWLGYHSAAIKSDGSLWMWGDNRCGQLGDETTDGKRTPIKIMDNVKYISLGGTIFSAAIKEDGSIWTWGQNQYGQLGDGTTENKHVPIRISSINVTENTGKYSYASAGGITGKIVPYEYNDFYFDDSSYDYNHDLAKMSLALALTTYDYTELRRVMNGIGFIESTFEANDYYIRSNTGTDKTEPDNVGVGIARKKIGDYTVLAVAIRGFGYGKEWSGNFNVGSDSEYHEGFMKARDIVIDFITQYLDKNSIEGKVKIWLTGYSRAGATANLVAGALDGGERFKRTYFPNQGQAYTINDNLSFENKDVYTYCFEPPAGLKKIPTGWRYDNIFNIVNPNDLVTKVAPAQWGFRRYGVDLYLPSKETTKYYDASFNAMAKEYLKYCNVMAKDAYGTSVNTVYLIDRFRMENPYFAWWSSDMSQAVFLDNLFGVVANTYSADRYKQNLQNDVRKILESPGFSKDQLSLKFKDILDAVWVAIIAYPHYSYSAWTNMNGLVSGHYPDLCLAWMHTLSGILDDGYTSGNYRTAYVNCPVDIDVYDSSNALVAQIINDRPQEIDGNSVLAVIDEDGQKVIYLPADEEYIINMTATGNGNMTYSLQEYDRSQGVVDRAINYYDVSLQTGKGFVATAGIISEEDTIYSLSEANGSNIEPSDDMKGDEVQYKNVDIEIEGSGQVSGAGSRVKGNYARLTAISDENSEFIGFYTGEILITNNAEYRFCVFEDVKITAKFKDIVRPLKSINLNKTKIILNKGQTEKLTVTYNPANTTDNKQVTWITSNANIATVSNGVVTAKNLGTVTITAKVGDAYATCHVTVTASMTTVTKKSLSTPKGLKLTKKKASWKKVANNNGYSLKVMQGKKTVFTVKIKKNKTSHKFTKTQLKKLKKGNKYHFTLVAKGKGNFKNSKAAKSKVLKIKK